MTFRGSTGYLGGAGVGAYGFGVGYRYDHDLFTLDAGIQGLVPIAEEASGLHGSLDGTAAWVIPMRGPLRPYIGAGGGLALLSAWRPEHEAAGVEALLTGGVVLGRSRQLPIFLQMDVRVPVVQLGRDPLGTSALLSVGFGLTP